MRRRMHARHYVAAANREAKEINARRGIESTWCMLMCESPIDRQITKLHAS